MHDKHLTPHSKAEHSATVGISSPDPQNTKSNHRIGKNSTKDEKFKEKSAISSGNREENNSSIPEPIDKLIRLLCADYPRRDRVISERAAPYNVIMEYRFLNYRILNAATEIAGSRDARDFISDIGSNRGYSSSELWILPERIYKERKGAVKHNIARRLSLI